jgi:hypothetical protein
MRPSMLGKRIPRRCFQSCTDLRIEVSILWTLHSRPQTECTSSSIYIYLSEEYYGLDGVLYLYSNKDCNGNFGQMTAEV